MLLAKTTWQYPTNSELLCHRILKAKYCTNKSLLEVSYKMINLLFWKGFIEAVKVVKANVSWIIGNDEGIPMWNKI